MEIPSSQEFIDYASHFAYVGHVFGILLIRTFQSQYPSPKVAILFSIIWSAFSFWIGFASQLFSYLHWSYLNDIFNYDEMMTAFDRVTPVQWKLCWNRARFYLLVNILLGTTCHMVIAAYQATMTTTRKDDQENV